MSTEKKIATAFLTITGGAFHVTPVNWDGKARKYEFLNEQKIYGLVYGLRDLVDGRAKSVALYVNEPLKKK